MRTTFAYNENTSQSIRGRGKLALMKLFPVFLFRFKYEAFVKGWCIGLFENWTLTTGKQGYTLGTLASVKNF